MNSIWPILIIFVVVVGSVMFFIWGAGGQKMPRNHEDNREGDRL